MDSLMQILGYIFPAGLGTALGATFGWFLNRRLSKVRQGSDIDAAYLDNINMLRDELIKIQDENRKLYRAIARLDRTVAKATSCRHWDNCPIRNELQKSGQDDSHPLSKRQPAKRKTIRSDPPARSGQRSADEVADETTGCIAGRRGV